MFAKKEKLLVYPEENKVVKAFHYTPELYGRIPLQDQVQACLLVAAFAATVAPFAVSYLFELRSDQNLEHQL